MTMALFSQETHPQVDPPLPTNSSLQAVLKEIGCRSLMIAPLKIHENIFGFVCLVLTRPGLGYGESDQAFASELTDRASLMFENASLYRSTQQALRHRDAFLAVASHELRTPVTSVRAVAQLLIQQISLSPDQSTYHIARMAKILDEQSDRLTRLVGQLLDVTQIELGKLKLTRKEVELSNLVQTIAEAARVRYPDFTFNVRTSGPVTAFVDPIRLEQVVVNLVENAIRYAQEGRKIDIEVSETDAEEFRISVRDYGKGIPEDLRGRLFQRFERAKKDEFSSGLGMGLFISKQIIEMHGGKIRAESAPGGGAKFVITAPMTSVVRMPLRKSA
jgi:signal transduction histidine kinase